jgi:kumamolisin
MIAPAAKIIYYQTTFAGTGLLDAYKRILSDGQASIVSISIGACDPAKPDPNDVQIPEGEALAALRQKHVNVFVSSGDHGVYACIAAAWAGHDPYWAVAGSWPGDSADVVSVGGTYLQHGADGTYESEAAWVSPLTNWSTGGGVNPSVAAPAWQTGLRVGPPAGVTNRAFPDVAAPADEESGWTIVVKGQIDRSSGTSAAAPFWAGYAALVRQAAGEAHTGTFPFLAPVLYAIANSTAGAGSFHDVTRGSNLRDNAETGWDDATGLGSPVGANLADAIVSYLQANPNAAVNDDR